MTSSTATLFAAISARTWVLLAVSVVVAVIAGVQFAVDLKKSRRPRVEPIAIDPTAIEPVLRESLPVAVEPVVLETIPSVEPQPPAASLPTTLELTAVESISLTAVATPGEAPVVDVTDSPDPDAEPIIDLVELERRSDGHADDGTRPTRVPVATHASETGAVIRIDIDPSDEPQPTAPSPATDRPTPSAGHHHHH